MTTLRKTLFISDLHLQEANPHSLKQFHQLLHHCDSSIDAIYILGDLFEAWIGDDDDNLFHRDVIQSLKRLTQTGTPVYFLPGNRDFLIGKRFLQESGCQRLKEEHKIILYGAPILLMHGDTLCTKDIAYLKWRKKARNPILHTLLFLSLPLILRRKFADKMRTKSAQYTQQASSEIMDVTEEEVKRKMEYHHVSFLIHGHTHRPAFHNVKLNSGNATRVVLGAWHKEASILVWNSAREKNLVGLDYFIKQNNS